MPLKPRRRRPERRPIQLIDDAEGQRPTDVSAHVVPFLLGGVVAVGSLLAVFWFASLTGDRTSMLSPPRPVEAVTVSS